MDLSFEQKYFDKDFSVAIGTDEVGRGCLAGPVVAAAVAVTPLHLEANLSELLEVVADSKTLTPKKREKLSKRIQENFLYTVAEVSAERIDEINIHTASLEAMRLAIFSLHEKLEKHLQSRPVVLVDGKFTVPQVSFLQNAIIDGDAKVFAIAAASIVAKVYRDDLMAKFDEQFPVYGFAKHKGYGTAAHYKALQEKGVSSLHRKSFRLFHETGKS